MSDEKDIAFPFFFIKAAPDDAATKKNGGIPVFRDVEMVRIQIPGIRDEVSRPVEDKDKTRWPMMYKRFKDGETQAVDGVPLSEFATATESERATLKSVGIQTVEQIAGINDDSAQKLHVVALKKKAREFLETREKFASVGKLEARILELERKLKEKDNANVGTVVSGSDAGNGVQSPIDVPIEPVTGRAAVGGSGKRGRQRTGGSSQVAAADG